MKLTKEMKTRGEMAVRFLAPQAEAYYDNSDVTVWEIEDDHYIIDDCGERFLCTFKEMNELFRERAEQADIVVNPELVVIDYSVAESLMDEELMEQIHRAVAPCTKQNFFILYTFAHRNKFGEEWELAKANPQY